MNGRKLGTDMKYRRPVVGEGQNQLNTWLGLGHPIFEGPPGPSVQELILASGLLGEKLCRPQLLVSWDKARRGLSRLVQGPGPIVCSVPRTP